MAEVLFVARWIHFVAGITWVGLLYFFNAVNVPSMKIMDVAARPAVVVTLLPRALAWFRHAAWVTVLAGLVMLGASPDYWAGGHFLDTDKAKTIDTGMLLGLIMLYNVWMVIWPNQRKLIEATAAQRTPDPSWARTALYTSRVNTILSFPLLAFMAGASHYPMDWPHIIIVGLIAALIAALIVFYVHKAWIFTPSAARTA